MIVCSPSCGVAPNSTSGGEVLERELLTALPGAGVTPHVLLARHQRATIPVERIRWGRGLRWWLMPFVMAPAIRRCLRLHEAEVLRAHSAKFLGLACLLAKNGTPLVVHVQHLDRRPHPLERLAIRRADRVIAISRFTRTQIMNAELRRTVVDVVSPGVDHAVFRPAPRRTYGRRLLFVGGLKPRKNPLRLLSILKQIPDATLTVVGDGPMRRLFCRTAQAWGLQQRVVVHTGVADQDRASFYHRAEVFVFPSDLEGFGMPVLEAMACGLPVVCSNRGALPELIPPPRSCDPERVIQMASQICLLLGDPALAAEGGQRNYERSQEYSWERCAKETRAVYERALA